MFYTKKSFYLIIIIVIILVIGVIYFTGKPKATEYETITAETGELIQEVSVTGTVKAAEEVVLAFEKGGKISALPVKVGELVRAGQVVARLTNADMAAQLNQAKAAVEKDQAQLKQYEAALTTAEAKLEEYKKGNKPEEIQLAETAVDNATKSLADAETTLKNVQEKATADLNEDYNLMLTAVSNSITVAEKAIFTLSDIQIAHFAGTSQEDNKLATAKSTAIYILWGEANAGRWAKRALSGLTGGTKGTVVAAEISPTNNNIDLAAVATKAALQSVKTALESVTITPDLSTTDISGLNTEKSSVNTEISTINIKEQTIAVQKSTNQSSIFTAEASVNTAKNNLATKQDEWLVKKSGYTVEQITGVEAQVKQAEANLASQVAQIKSSQANVQNYQAQLAKTVLSSPIAGIVTAVEPKLGEIVAMNTAIAKVISEAEYQIEANVPEVDIANIKINDMAKVTLDAYSSDTEFIAKVLLIDPAETLIDSVPTYKVTFAFTEKNEIIKSGMTADLDILTEKKDNVVSIPQRAIFKKDNQKIVRLLNEDGVSHREVAVKTGLRGSNGNVEILDGVVSGDKVVISIKNGK